MFDRELFLLMMLLTELTRLPNIPFWTNSRMTGRMVGAQAARIPTWTSMRVHTHVAVTPTGKN